MKMLLKHVNEVEQGELLAEDIYIDDVLLLKKGTKLTKDMLYSLKRRKIEFVKTITEISKEDLVEPPPKESKITKSVSPQDFIQREEKAKKTFVQMLSTIGYEHRLGKLLNRNEDVQFLTDLFVDFHKKYFFIDIFYSLKSWDQYTFTHSFDVFIIGTILAKKHGLPNLENVALGYLLHDIGKLTISPDLLIKQRKLTLFEFEKVKKHTVEGEAILKSLGQHQISHFARSHHERLDGSGYPDRLTENDISKELKILQLVDVYSALTLHRSYKAELPAHEAIQILYRDKKKFDSDLTNSLIESLKIYPIDSIVLLSNNQTAKINSVNQKMPTIPDVSLLNQNEKYELPIDYSVTVTKMIKYESKSLQNSYNDFINFLITGNKREAIEEFYYLIDGLRLEEVYVKVILPTYWNLVKLHKSANNIISFQKFNVALDILINLLDEFETEIVKSNECVQKVLFIINEKPESRLQVKVLLHLLQIEQVFPLILNPGISNEDLKSFLFNNQIDKICLIDLEDEYLQTYAILEADGIQVYKKTSEDLEAILKTINCFEESIVFEQLFSSADVHAVKN